MPLACQPVQIAGRNRIWRKMVIDAIRDDPDWKNGEYTTQPWNTLKIAAEMFFIAAGAPLQMQKNLPTRDATDSADQGFAKQFSADHDANDLLFAVNASRNYDPSPQLEKITVPVMFVNSADDFINPPELGIAERETKRVKNGRFILIPTSERTRGHGTHVGRGVAAISQGAAGRLATLSCCRQSRTNFTSPTATVADRPALPRCDLAD